MFFRCAAVVAVSLVLLSCGGSGGGSGDPAPALNETPGTPDVEAEKFPVASGRDIILNNYKELDGVSQAMVLNVSAVNKAQYASAFSLTSPARIDQVTWVGVADFAGSASAAPNFLVRIMRANGNVPDPLSVVAEGTFVASAISTGASSGNNIYSFNIFTEGGFVSLGPGNYFISVLDPEIEGMDFLWAREEDAASFGGAFRNSSIASWRTESLGRNIRIAGICDGPCYEAPVVPGPAAGSGIMEAYGQYAVAKSAVLTRNGLGVTPVYFVGLYEPEVRGSTVTIEIGYNQLTPEVILIVSAYEPVQWHITGDGAAQISQLYEFSYNSGTFNLTPNTFGSYTYDKGNYIGSVNDWPDPPYEDYYDTEGRATLDQIESIVGRTITSYLTTYHPLGVKIY